MQHGQCPVRGRFVFAVVLVITSGCGRAIFKAGGNGTIPAPSPKEAAVDNRTTNEASGEKTGGEVANGQTTADMQVVMDDVIRNGGMGGGTMGTVTTNNGSMGPGGQTMPPSGSPLPGQTVSTNTTTDAVPIARPVGSPSTSTTSTTSTTGSGGNGTAGVGACAQYKACSNDSMCGGTMPYCVPCPACGPFHCWSSPMGSSSSGGTVATGGQPTTSSPFPSGSPVARPVAVSTAALTDEDFE